jgi:hypothetical protein
MIALVASYWLDQEPEQLRRAEPCARTALPLDDHDAASHEAAKLTARAARRSWSRVLGRVGMPYARRSGREPDIGRTLPGPRLPRPDLLRGPLVAQN